LHAGRVTRNFKNKRVRPIVHTSTIEGKRPTTDPNEKEKAKKGEQTGNATPDREQRKTAQKERIKLTKIAAKNR